LKAIFKYKEYVDKLKFRERLMSIRKLIIVTSEHDPLRSKIKKICNEIAEKYGVELDIKYEDWDFLRKYGEEDELGGYSFPQVFIEYDDGRIEHILTRIPLNNKGKLDRDLAMQIIEKKFSG